MRRQKTCMRCDLKKKICGTWFCKICGCSIKIKTRVEDEKCPMDKW